MTGADAQSATRTLPLHRNLDYVLLWTGTAISAIGSQVSAIGYPLLTLAVTGSATKAGLIATVALLAAAVLRLPAGALVDRWDRRLVMIGSDLMRGTALASIAVAVAASALTFTQLLIVAVVEGAGGVFYRPAATAAVRRVVRPSQLRAAVAADEARASAASLAGPPIGGALYGVAQVLPFLADAASYVYSLLAALFVRTPTAPDRGHERVPLRRDIGTGLRWINEHPVIRWILSVAAATNFLIAALELATIVIARQRGASGAQIGWMLAIAGLGGIVGAALAPFIARKVEALRLVRTVTWASAATLPIMAAWPSVWVLGAMLGCRLLVTPAANTVLIAHQIQATPDELQGRVSAAGYLIAGLAAPLGPIAAGVLLTATGPVTTLVMLAAFAAGIAVSTTLSRSARSLVTETATP